MLRRVKRIFEKGARCGDCRDYDKCYELQLEYNCKGTLDIEACVWFEKCEIATVIEECQNA